MLIRRFKPNKKDPVELEYADGTKLLMSYECPIAAFIPQRGFLVTDLDLTPTNRTRIADWLAHRPAASCTYVSQDELFKLITSRRVLTTADIADQGTVTPGSATRVDPAIAGVTR